MNTDAADTSEPREGGRSRFMAFTLPLIFLGMVVCAFMLHMRELGKSGGVVAEALAGAVAAEIQESVDGVAAAGDELARAFETTPALREGGASAESRIPGLLARAAGSAPYVSGVSVAPSAIVKYHYPPAEAGEMAGHDLLSNPDRRDELAKAMETKAPVLSGPNESVEGRETYFLRYPLFVEEKLWGFVSLTIDFDVLKASFGLEKKYPALNFGFSFAPAARAAQAAHAEPAVRLFGAEWRISVTPGDAGLRGGRAVPDLFLLMLLLGALVGPALLFLVLYRAGAVHPGVGTREKSAPRRAAEKAHRGIDRVADIGNRGANDQSAPAFMLEAERERPRPPSSGAEAGTARESPADQRAAKDDQAEVRPVHHRSHEAHQGQSLGPSLFPGLAPLVGMSGRDLTFKGPDVKGEVYMPEIVIEHRAAPEPAGLAAPEPAVQPAEPNQQTQQTRPTQPVQSIKPAQTAQPEPSVPAEPSPQRAVKPAVQPARIVIEESIPAPAVSPLKILVVDDSEANREIMGRMLALRGYAAEFAASGEEAIRLESALLPRIVFMDCFMPGMDGYEATRRIRGQARTVKPRIVGMSARIGEAEKARCVEAGMDDLLAKPFTLRELVDQLADRR